MTNKRIFLIFIIIIALSNSVFYAFLFKKELSKKDELQYTTIGQNIANGNGFSISKKPPFTCTIYREPIYPFFLSVFYRIFGNNVFIIQIVQIFFWVFTCLLTYHIALKISNYNVARLSAIFLSICPTLAGYTRYILSETIFTFLLVSGVYCIINYLLVKKGIWFLLFSIAMAIATLTKAVLIFYIFAVVFVMVLGGKKLRLDFNSYKPIIGGVLLFLFILSPWIARNAIIFNTYSITVRQGLVFYDRAKKLEESTKDMVKYSLYSFSESVAKIFFPETNIEEENFLLQGSKEANLKFMELMNEYNMNEVDANDVMLRDSIVRIKTSPAKYIVQSFLEFFRMSGFLYIPILNEMQFKGYSNITISLLRGGLKVFSYLLMLSSIASLFLFRNKWKILFPIFILLIYNNVICSMLYGNPRYNVPFIPFYIILFFMTLSVFRIGKKVDEKTK